MTAPPASDRSASHADPVVHIFADESCLGNQFGGRANPGGAAGLVERFEPRRGWYRRDYRHFDPDTTNNRMAITSALVPLEALRRPCRVVLTSDSQYLVKGMSEWVPEWARRGWRRKGGPIENLELWRKLAGAAARHCIEWRWVRGHADHAKNEYANWLAVRTATEREGSGRLEPSGFEAWLEGQRERGRFEDFLDLPDETFNPGPPPPRL